METDSSAERRFRRQAQVPVDDVNAWSSHAVACGAQVGRRYRYE